MDLGITVTPTMLAVSGTLAFLLMVFQILQGKRIIKFKGALHRKVHGASAWVLLAATVLHGLLGYLFWLRLTAGV